MIVEPEDLFVVISYKTSDLEDRKSIIFKFVSMILLSFSVGEGFFRFPVSLLNTDMLLAITCEPGQLCVAWGWYFLLTNNK